MGGDLVRNVRRLAADDRISKIIDYRVKEFLKTREEGLDRVFIELSFCILTANYRADKSIYIQRRIWRGFLEYPYDILSIRLRELGYRYPYTRAKYIVEARDKLDIIGKIIYSDLSRFKMRELLSKHIRGIGYKEASHFLRNIGYFELAILDRHILRLLKQYNYISNIPRLNKRIYNEIEQIVINIADEVGTMPGILDLYLWYMMTGRILK